MGLRTQREALEEEKTRLQWKLKMYQKQTDGIGGLWHDQSRLERHIQALEEQLGETREDLQDLLTRAGDIEDFLDATVEALRDIEQTVSIDWHTLHLDAMNVEVNAEAGTPALSLCAIRIGRRQPRIVQLIKFSPDFVSVDTGKALRRAARALGVH
jgi:DNA repair exonuclease SbcCD ATPase subunit